MFFFKKALKSFTLLSITKGEGDITASAHTIVGKGGQSDKNSIIMQTTVHFSIGQNIAHRIQRYAV